MRTLQSLVIFLCFVAAQFAAAVDYDFRAETAKYLVPISLPACTGNPKAVLIRSIQDWKLINSSRYTVFCVVPGNYLDAGVIELSADGSVQQKRWLRWFDPANPTDTTTHPAQMSESKRAVIRQLVVGSGKALGRKTINSANYWVIDRMTVRGSLGSSGFDAGSANNVLNRTLIEDANSNALVFWDSSQNTVQNSVLRNAVPKPGTDRSLIFFGSNGPTKVINNELYNATASGIQIGPQAPTGNYVIAGNEIYLTPARYTNCDGQWDPAGECACSEIGIALKGPHGAGGIVAIENNVLHGFRKTDTSCGGTGGPGEAIDLGAGGYSVDNVSIRKNIIFDTASYGLYFGANVTNVRIEGNLFAGINTENGTGTAIYNGFGNTVKAFRNTIVDSDNWYRTTQRVNDTKVECNAVIDGGKFVTTSSVSSTFSVKNNYLYGSNQLPAPFSAGNYATNSELSSKNTDLCINLQRYTASMEKCLALGQSSAASPQNSCVTSVP